jgi:hypothetical protein
VPTISRFRGITIQMYFRDHEPPHFHAIAGGNLVRIRIDEDEVLSGKLSRRQLVLVRRWAKLHRKELEDNWKRARERERLVPIEPLR